MIASCPMQYGETTDRDVQLGSWIYLDLAESKSREIMKAYDCFYYINGRFPPVDNLITLRKSKIPDFIQAEKEIFPIALYKPFRGGKLHALVCTQILCVLNIHLQGNPKLSRDKMSTFYLSMQALSKSKSEVLQNFDAISGLVMNINYLLQKQTYTFKMEEQ